MEYEQKLRIRNDQLQAELANVARSFQEIVSEADKFLARYGAARDYPVSLALEEARFVPEEPLAATQVLPPLLPTPTTAFLLARYERRLLDMLAMLREAMVTYEERVRYGNPYQREVNLQRLNDTLSGIRRVQRSLNRTGHWNFLLS